MASYLLYKLTCIWVLHTSNSGPYLPFLCFPHVFTSFWNKIDDKQHRQTVTLHLPIHWGITRLTELEPSIYMLRSKVATWVSFLSFLASKSCQACKSKGKGDNNQCLECAAPKRWSKYATFDPSSSLKCPSEQNVTYFYVVFSDIY